MSRGARSLAVVLCAALAGSACATHQSRMQLGLDGSMERVLRTEAYLSAVSGISAFPERISRSDGMVYLSDIAPQLRYLANTGDTVRYLALRRFIVGKMLRRDSAGLAPVRAFREGAPFEPATQYGVRWLTKALRDGWQQLGDTLSAVSLAQLAHVDAPLPAHATRMYVLAMKCADAMDVVDSDPGPARALLAEARTVVSDRAALAEQASAGVTQVEGEVDLLSCLTRLGLGLNDPDVTVRYLDHMLGHLAPLLNHSGRPDLGTTADILLTLHRVRLAGPRYYDPPALGAKPRNTP